MAALVFDLALTLLAGVCKKSQKGYWPVQFGYTALLLFPRSLIDGYFFRVPFSYAFCSSPFIRLFSIFAALRSYLFRIGRLVNGKEVK